MALNPIIIETGRLILKGFSPQDMTFIFENFPPPQIMAILGHGSEDAYLAEKRKQMNGYAAYNKSFRLFLLIEKRSGNIIGRCGLHHWDQAHRRAEVGYIMTDETFRERGLMTEAVHAVIAYGFDNLELHRIEAQVGSNNIPSLKIIERLHFTREGLLRQHYRVGDTYEDSIVFSLLQNEYREAKGEKKDRFG